MTGHQAIVALRLRRMKPNGCTLYVYDCAPVYRWYWEQPELAMHNGFHPSVDILPDDVVPTLDLRFVRDLTVHVVGWQPARTRAVFDHAVQFAPAKMAAALDDVFLWYSPDVGVVDLNNPQRMAA